MMHLKTSMWSIGSGNHSWHEKLEILMVYNHSFITISKKHLIFLDVPMKWQWKMLDLSSEKSSEGNLECKRYGFPLEKKSTKSIFPRSKVWTFAVNFFNWVWLEMESYKTTPTIWEIGKAGRWGILETGFHSAVERVLLFSR